MECMVDGLLVQRQHKYERCTKCLGDKPFDFHFQPLAMIIGWSFSD